MKDLSFDTHLIASAPINNHTDSDFTNRVMRKIHIIQIATDSTQSQTIPNRLFFSKLHHIPRLAIVLIAVAALTVLGGTAYAVYKALWEQPRVTISEQTTNQFGRKQLAASFVNCSDQQSETAFEIKLGNTLNSAEISKILQAYCEEKVISEWSGEKDPQADAGKKPNLGTSQSTMTMLYPSAAEVKSIDTQRLVLTGDPQIPTEPLALTNQTQYIANGSYVTLDQIHKGDTVLFVQNITTSDSTTKNEKGEDVTSSTPTSREITYVIKVGLPYEYYNTKQNLITQRQDCVNNPQDSCVQTQTIDLYNASLRLTASSERRSIQGVVTSLDGSTIKIQSSSGKLITLTAPSDIVTNFNQNKSSTYGGIKVAVGDLLQIRYITDKDGSELNLETKHIESIQLALSVSNKNSSITKY